MRLERVYYGEVTGAYSLETCLITTGEQILCEGKILDEFVGRRVKVTITELEADSQEDTLISQVQELARV